VACSGGADSLALLALGALAADPVAVYVDHGLRPESAADGRFVCDVASSLGVAVTVVPADVGAGPNVEERARDARRAALLGAAERVDASPVLLGHTMDDQAETVLLNMMRGGALSGLAGMPARSGPISRPLLGFRRTETLEICRRLRTTPRRDAMNDDEGFRRVWLRKRALPLLDEGFDRDLVPVLARQAAIARDELAVLDALADDVLQSAVDPEARGAGSERGWLDAATVAAAPRAVARRVLRRWIGPPAPDAARIDDALAVAGGTAVAAHVGGGREVRRSSGRLHLLDVPGSSSTTSTTVTASGPR